MPLYACTKCNTAENTALGGYWEQQRHAHKTGAKHEPLCSQCDPEIGSWHDRFPRVDASTYEPDPSNPRYLRQPQRPADGPRNT